MRRTWGRREARVVFESGGHRSLPNASDNRDPDDFQEQFSGEWDGLEDYVVDFWEQAGWKPEEDNRQWWHPTRYIDWEGMARDLQLNGDVWTAQSSDFRTYVFQNN
jgi:antirestriction protein